MRVVSCSFVYIMINIMKISQTLFTEKSRSIFLEHLLISRSIFFSRTFIKINKIIKILKCFSFLNFFVFNLLELSIKRKTDTKNHPKETLLNSTRFNEENPIKHIYVRSVTHWSIFLRIYNFPQKSMCRSDFEITVKEKKYFFQLF